MRLLLIFGLVALAALGYFVPIWLSAIIVVVAAFVAYSAYDRDSNSGGGNPGGELLDVVLMYASGGTAVAMAVGAFIRLIV